jgi:uncharacterized lipoprotein NlpE involved in copper resistance
MKYPVTSPAPIKPLRSKGMKKILILAVFVLGLLGCNNDKEKVLELEAELLELHDEVMTKLDEIMTLKSRLAKKIQSMDSLQNEGISGNDLAQQRMKAVEITQKLGESDKLMMKWMQEYNGDSAKKLKPSESILYFEKERTKMEEVKTVTLKTIQEAKDYLN